MYQYCLRAKSTAPRAKIMFMEFVWGANLSSKDKDCAIAWNSRPKNGLLVKVVPHKCRMSSEHVRTVHGVHEGTSLLCLLEVVQKQMFQAHCRPWKWTVHAVHRLCHGLQAVCVFVMLRGLSVYLFNSVYLFTCLKRLPDWSWLLQP